MDNNASVFRNCTNIYMFSFFTVVSCYVSVILQFNYKSEKRGEYEHYNNMFVNINKMATIEIALELPIKLKLLKLLQYIL